MAPRHRVRHVLMEVASTLQQASEMAHRDFSRGILAETSISDIIRIIAAIYAERGSLSREVAAESSNNTVPPYRNAVLALVGDLEVFSSATVGNVRSERVRTVLMAMHGDATERVRAFRATTMAPAELALQVRSQSAVGVKHETQIGELLVANERTQHSLMGILYRIRKLEKSHKRMKDNRSGSSASSSSSSRSSSSSSSQSE